jgi:hypothetical protein
MCSRTAGRCRSRMLGAALSLTALIAVLWLPAPGRAQAPLPLHNMTPPNVVGSASVGQILTGVPGVWTGEAPLELGYQWRRCEIAGPCTDIPGASTPTYSVGPGDVGLRIRFRVIASSGGATEVLDSEPTEAVPGERERAALGPREPSAAASPPAVPAAPAPASRPVRARLIDPFPVVRITGWYTARRTVFRRVTVRAPAGARIAISCTGRGCPFHERRRTVSGRALVRIAALQRRFRPRVRLLLLVTEPGRIGKYTRITVRRGRAPARRDACVMPGGAQPVACRSA